MTSEGQQIKDSYEVHSMSPEEIASDRELNVVAVKAMLMQVSSKYRKDCSHEDESVALLNYTEEECQRALTRILEIGLSSDNEMVALRACESVVAEKRGRKDVVRNMANQTFNIFDFNRGLQGAREQMKLAGVTDV